MYWKSIINKNSEEYSWVNVRDNTCKSQDVLKGLMVVGYIAQWHNYNNLWVLILSIKSGSSYYKVLI